MDTDRLAELIDRKLDVLQQLRQLAGRQLKLIQQGDMAGLIGLLSVKQRLLDGLHQLERQLDPFRQQEPESRTWRSPAARSRTRETAARCEQLLSEIMKSEQRCETTLADQRDHAAARLENAHTARQASHAYTQQSQLPERGHLDLSSET